VGTILLVGESGPMALLRRQDPGGALLRQLLPLVVLILLAVGFLRVRGQLLGYYDMPLGTAILVFALIILFSLFLWRSALHLSRSAAAEAAAGRALAASEARLRRLNEELERRVAAQTEEIRQANTMLEERIAQRTTELQVANETLRRSRLAALNLMEDAVAARKRAEETTAALQHEILERERSEKERERLTDELEQRVGERTRELAAANKELESFSYSVSHDLKAPLRAIMGFSELLLKDRESRLSEQARHYLDTVIAGADGMSRLIDDILAFSRLSSQELMKSTVNMDALVRSVVEGQRSGEVGTAEIVIGSLPPVCGDNSMIRQVMTNLLSNAFKFTRNVAHPRIEIGAVRAQGEIVYYVKDNGVGFDMQQAGKLFGVFQRLHSAQEYEGTGVGLAFSKRILERHGGRIWAEGKVNEGATFYVALPA
ncbi:MAG TPA: ATP-binding protein, partial [Bacteroidota bacterium]